MEDALIEVPTKKRFAGIDLISERILDETTIYLSQSSKYEGLARPALAHLQFQ